MMTISYAPVLIYFLLTITIIAAILFVSSKIGPHKTTKQKMMPYECGVDPGGSLEIRFPIRFYIIAMLFIIFDIETVFLYPWAVTYRELGWFGFIEMVVFVGILLIGLLYLFKKGALEWE